MTPTHECLLQAVRHGLDAPLRQIVVLLEAVAAPHPLTVRGLAAHMQVPKSAITRAVDRLEELHWAARQPDPADKRSILLVPTEQGREIANRLFKAGSALALAA